MPQESETTKVDKKCIGIDPEKLLSKKVLSFKTSFWTEMKAQTDALQNHYLQREKRIYITLQRIQRSERYCTNDQIVKRLHKLHMDVSSLVILVEDSLDEFVQTVKEFDAHHNQNTVETETELLHNSYDFTNCNHLRKIIRCISKRIEEHDGNPESRTSDDEAELEQEKNEDCSKAISEYTECTTHMSLESRIIDSEFSTSGTQQKEMNKRRSMFSFKKIFQRRKNVFLKVF